MTAEERIQLLKKAIRIEPEFCIERARLYMEAHKGTTNLPPALRRCNRRSLRMHRVLLAAWQSAALWMR